MNDTTITENTNLGGAMTVINPQHPIMKAWLAYQQTEGYKNTFKWAAIEEHRDGALWSAFLEGYQSAVEQNESLQGTSTDTEEANPAPRLRDGEMNNVKRLIEAEQACLKCQIKPFQSTDHHKSTAHFTRDGELWIQNTGGATVRFTYEQAKALLGWLNEALEERE